MSVATVLEQVYTSLHNDNEDLDARIHELKAALAAEGKKTVEVMPDRLPQNNRQGRKMMQAYFKKRGVVVEFKEA